MTMDDFDDQDLRSRLERLAGPGPDASSAYADVRRRVRTARRRRSALAVGGAGTAVVALIALAVTSGDGRSERRISPAETGPPASVDDAAPGKTGTTTTARPAPTSGVPVIELPVPTDIAPSSSASPPSVAPGTTAGTVSPPASATPPPASSISITRSYESIGGRITVRLGARVVGLVSFETTTGFTARIDDDGPERVRVRFESPDHESRIEVEAVGGDLVPRIDENESGSRS